MLWKLPLTICLLALTASCQLVRDIGANRSSGECGTERDAVKTLSDPDAARVSLTPTPTSVDALRGLAAPEALTDLRIGPTEFYTYSVQADMMAVKLEQDRDFHLVIADPVTGATMIVEFVDAECAGNTSAQVRALMQQARLAFVNGCVEPKASFQDLRGVARISGVGFFDKIHGQTGVAPNGIELHPVLVFEGSCH